MTTQNNPHKFELGSTLQCTVTGFVGIAISRVDHLNGCVQYCLKPPTVEDKPHERPEGFYIDDEQLAFVDRQWLDTRENADREMLAEHGLKQTGGPESREGELPT